MGGKTELKATAERKGRDGRYGGDLGTVDHGKGATELGKEAVRSDLLVSDDRKVQFPKGVFGFSGWVKESYSCFVMPFLSFKSAPAQNAPSTSLPMTIALVPCPNAAPELLLCQARFSFTVLVCMPHNSASSSASSCWEMAFLFRGLLSVIIRI